MDEASAWSCLMANVMLPGLGSIVAGKRVGYFQAAVAVIGEGLTLYWGVWCVATLVRTRQIPIQLERHLLIGAAGVFIFLGALLWALISGMMILWEARRKKNG